MVRTGYASSGRRGFLARVSWIIEVSPAGTAARWSSRSAAARSKTSEAALTTAVVPVAARLRSGLGALWWTVQVAALRGPSERGRVSPAPRRRLTYSHVVATLALTLAIGGTAYAAATLPAGSVGSRQLRKAAVTPSKVAPATVALFRGRTGPQGRPGNPAAYPAILPSGRTETGAFAVRWTASNKGQSEDAEVSFPLALASAPAVYCGTVCPGLTPPPLDTTRCPGTPAAPAATAGNLCIYIGQQANLNSLTATDLVGNPGTIGKVGGVISVASNSVGDTLARGSWAVTAP